MKQTKEYMKNLRRRSSEEKLRGGIAKIKISVNGLQTIKNTAKDTAGNQSYNRRQDAGEDQGNASVFPFEESGIKLDGRVNSVNMDKVPKASKLRKD